MAKRYSEDGKIWWESKTDEPYTIGIGFTAEFMDNVLGECWHILPVIGRVTKGDTLVMLETNDGMEKVKSPFSGTILEFSDIARNFPEKLDPNIALLFFRESPTEEEIKWPPPSRINLSTEERLFGIDPRVLVNLQRNQFVIQTGQPLAPGHTVADELETETDDLAGFRVPPVLRQR